MQPNPYQNDPNYIQPTETNPPTPPYQQGGQYTPPPYQNQTGEPTYPPYQYGTQPAQDAQRAAMRQQQSGKYVVAKIIDYVRWAIVALELLFLLRFILKLIGADPTNPFAQFLYNFTGFFLYPFLGIVPSTKLGTHGVAVFEWSTLIGMAVYGILYWILMLFLRTTISRPQEPIQ
jgi:YGGT family